jgi:hypothetical protein
VGLDLVEQHLAEVGMERVARIVGKECGLSLDDVVVLLPGGGARGEEPEERYQDLGAGHGDLALQGASHLEQQ